MANAQLLTYLEELGPRRADGTLSVQNPDDGQEGSIGFSGGVIVTASTKSLKDLNAVFAMLAWENASVLWFENQALPFLSCEIQPDLVIFEFVQLEMEYGSSQDVLLYLDTLTEVEVPKRRKTIRLPDLTNFSVFMQLESDPTGKSDFELREGTLLMGKGSDCDIIVSDESVSRRHCQMALVDRTITLTDLGSTNGTYVNDVLVHQEFIVPGDKISLGSSHFQVVARMKRNLSQSEMPASKPIVPASMNTMKLPKNTQALHWDNLGSKKVDDKDDKSLFKRFLGKK
ncbi:MAG: FHA domain-containing protein [Blastochloris sp.]|nr:FHA domain-containing protein [Blastochloris sp.]